MAEKQKILIVDDDANIAELIELYLTKECFQCMQAQDGEEALKKNASFQPDLILLDIMLPGIDGYDVCREIRKTSTVPIIMLSAKGEVFDKVLGLELGADDYIIKPFDSKELVARVKAVLRRYQTGSAPAAPAASTETGTETIQYTDLTFHPRNILDDLVSLCLTERKIVFVLPVFFDQIDKGIDGKRIMLRRDTKFLFSCSLVFIVVLQKIDLLQNLSHIA